MFSLHIFVVGENPVTESFITKKRVFAEALGVGFIEHRFDTNISTDELLHEMGKICEKNQEKTGIVIQLPLPEHIDTDVVLNSVRPELDIDGLADDSKFLTPVAGAIEYILKSHNIDASGKKALVVGRGRLVGKGAERLLVQLGADVTVVDEFTDRSDFVNLCKESDIIISGAGVPNLITPEIIKNDCVLLDAGTSTHEGSIVGDIAHECESKARYFSRTPGGIGPMTVAILFKNLIRDITPEH